MANCLAAVPSVAVPATMIAECLGLRGGRWAESRLSLERKEMPIQEKIVVEEETDQHEWKRTKHFMLQITRECLSPVSKPTSLVKRFGDDGSE